MPWQALDKRRPSDWLAAIGVHAGHPPLTSLRSFAPPYALRRGRTIASIREHPVIASAARCHSERSEESSPLREA